MIVDAHHPLALYIRCYDRDNHLIGHVVSIDTETMWAKVAKSTYFSLTLEGPPYLDDVKIERAEIKLPLGGPTAAEVLELMQQKRKKPLGGE